MTDRKVSIYYQNCGGLRSKLVDLRLNILNSNYDVIVLTETWLVAGVTDSEVIDDRYVLYRKDRDSRTSCKRDGGGVLIATKRSIASNRRLDWEEVCLEHLTVSLLLGKHNLIISAVYIPPSSSTQLYKKFFSKCELIYDAEPGATLCLLGDFNLPHLHWLASDSKYLNLERTYNEASSLLLDTIQLIGTKQYNYLLNNDNRILDLLLCDIECIVVSPEVVLSRIDSHHPPFQFSTDFVCPDIQSKLIVNRYNYFKGDYETICKEMNSVNWDHEFINLKPDMCVNRFYDILFDIIKKYVPLVKIKSAKYPSWFSSPLRSCLKRKERVWRKWKQYNSTIDYSEYSLLRKRCKTLMKQCFRSYTDNVESSLRLNVKFFWKYVHSLKNSNNNYPATMYYNKSSSNDPNTISNMFSMYFMSVFQRQPAPDSFVLETFPVSISAPLVPKIIIKREEVEYLLKTIDTSKGAGPDGINPFFLKQTASCLSVPLHLIFNLCLGEGMFPDRWKLAYVTPIFKAGARSNIENYRPISSQSWFPKILESIVKGHVYNYMEPYLVDQQHGFMRSKSTCTNLVTYSDYLFKAIDRGHQVDAVYTDFMKAFDKVDHKLLLKKLAFNGIRGNLLRWFAAYLRNRTQVVVFNGHMSNAVIVSSGVVQGSVLGPLLYIIFINDLIQCFQNCEILMFADDLKIFKIVQSYNDCVDIQRDLDSFNSYCLENGLFLALDKCKVISFTKKRNRVMYDYRINSNVLSRVSVIRDLGVTFDEKLIFDQHIDSVCGKAYQMLGFVLRVAKHFRSSASYLLLYKSLIRSHLEYCSTVWNPYYAVYINRLEGIQKKMIRALHYRLSLPSKPYMGLLKQYKLLTLVDRRVFLDQTCLYSICNGAYNCPELTSRISFRIPPIRATRSQALFALPLTRTNAGKRAPIARMCDTHNAICLSVDIFSNSRLQFRRGIIELLSSNCIN